jgi:hypothetical protein
LRCYFPPRSQCSSLGVDETAFLAATAYRSTSFVTGIVDLTGRVARLLDVVEGRKGKPGFLRWSQHLIL